MSTNLLYYGDNLDVLRRHIKDESVDLAYALAEWSKTGSRLTDPRVYRREILPGHTDVRMVAIARATGLCVPYAREIRKDRIPHPRHWEGALGALVTAQ